MADEIKKPAPEPKKEEAPQPPAPTTPPSEQRQTTPEATGAAPGAAGGQQPALKPAAPTAPPTPAAAKPAAAPRPKTATPEVQAILQQLGAKGQHLEDTDPNIPTILVDRSVLVETLRRLKFEFRFEHLACITAIDVKDNFELVYNLWSYSKNRPFQVKVRTPRADAVVPSICSLWIGANWLEREEWDLMGVRFEGHPNMKRMFLPESWQGHPLRKDYDLKKEQFVALNDEGEDVAFPEPREGAW